MVPETTGDAQNPFDRRPVHNVRAMKPLPLLLLLALVACACGGTGSGSRQSPSSSPTEAVSPTAEPSPSASPDASPLPSEGAFAVLMTPTSEPTYVVSLVGFDGKVAAKAQASSPGKVTCGAAGGALVPPPVSTSNSRVYFMDAQGVVRFLTPAGASGKATAVPVGSQRHSAFAVSTDDKRIAVVVSDFSSTGVATSLYVEDLSGGTHHKVIFNETGAFGIWPTGWHGADLVVAKVPACAQGGGTFCCGPQELHVDDAGNADIRFTLGGPTCVIAGPPSAGGAICENDAQASVLDWSGTATRSFSIQGLTPAYLSPNSNQAALDKGNPSNFVDTVVEGSHTTFSDFQACGWIDSTRVLGTDRQGQPHVGDIVTGAVVSVAAQGLCAGRIPGAL
jgi:hypothetical protein